jgi:hypothetical protein
LNSRDGMPEPMTAGTMSKFKVRKDIFSKIFANEIKYYEELAINSGNL